MSPSMDILGGCFSKATIAFLLCTCFLSNLVNGSPNYTINSTLGTDLSMRFNLQYDIYYECMKSDGNIESGVYAATSVSNSITPQILSIAQSESSGQPGDGFKNKIEISQALIFKKADSANVDEAIIQHLKRAFKVTKMGDMEPGDYGFVHWESTLSLTKASKEHIKTASAELSMNGVWSMSGVSRQTSGTKKSTPPYAIRSYELEQRVLSAGIPLDVVADRKILSFRISSKNPTCPELWKVAEFNEVEKSIRCTRVVPVAEQLPKVCFEHPSGQRFNVYKGRQLPQKPTVIQVREDPEGRGSPNSASVALPTSIQVFSTLMLFLFLNM
eukprot:Nk52_evm12s247 gene=Nk52_evmTU12s247